MDLRYSAFLVGTIILAPWWFTTCSFIYKQHLLSPLFPWFDVPETFACFVAICRRFSVDVLWMRGSWDTVWERKTEIIKVGKSVRFICRGFHILPNLLVLWTLTKILPYLFFFGGGGRGGVLIEWLIYFYLNKVNNFFTWKPYWNRGEYCKYFKNQYVFWRVFF